MTVKGSGSPKSEAAAIWALQYRLVMSVLTGVAADVAALGLEVKELFVLGEIDRRPHPAEVAEALSMPKPTVTVYLKRLEAAGLVRRAIDPGDLRRHRLMVTPAGRKTLSRGQARVSEAFGERLARLSADEQDELRRLLEAMI